MFVPRSMLLTHLTAVRGVKLDKRVRDALRNWQETTVSANYLLIYERLTHFLNQRTAIFYVARSLFSIVHSRSLSFTVR